MNRTYDGRSSAVRDGRRQAHITPFCLARTVSRICAVPRPACAALRAHTYRARTHRQTTLRRGRCVCMAPWARASALPRVTPAVVPCGLPLARSGRMLNGAYYRMLWTLLLSSAYTTIADAGRAARRWTYLSRPRPRAFKRASPGAARPALPTPFLFHCRLPHARAAWPRHPPPRRRLYHLSPLRAVTFQTAGALCFGGDASFLLPTSTSPPTTLLPSPLTFSPILPLHWHAADSSRHVPCLWLTY